MVADTVANTSASILHFSLHHREAGRVAIQIGLLLFHAAAVWSAAMVLLASRAQWRVARGDLAYRLLAPVLWAAPAIGLLLFGSDALPAVDSVVLLVPLGTAIGFTHLWPGARAFYRHASQAARLLTIFLLLLLPGLAMYPTVWQLADKAKRRLIESQYAIQAASHPRELQTRPE